ncbi:hypothetical protein BD31_I0679 [Candidatus Nitrosopumilus salaria BD31]|uniref:Uncharacterized protein n=1 Tax=Candidatus Nitrosopumilus salarius BD31 TaxID=859350 RepID=I3D197_9ARCH|nr:hypothetical protein BD31_I0679 [Candidatus Nitrosopumilus salaria BD31]
MEEKCIPYVMSQHSPYLRKEAGKCVKNVISKEILKILKNLFAVLDSIFNFSKQFLTQI